MRVDVAYILMSMGFVPDVDFVAVQDTPTNVNVIWKSQTTMPTSAAIDAAAPIAASAIATKRAQVEKATATASIDAGALKAGDKNERLFVGCVGVMRDELNLHGLKINAILNAIDASTTYATLKTNIAAIPDYPTLTNAQLVTALKAKIAATPE